MTQGTHDFVDSAVETLKAGRHPFILVALHDRDQHGERTFHIRSGYVTKKDVDALKDILADHVPGYLAERERDAEADGR